MRAISLWQPWASLIEAGAKPFETRSWSTDYRGPLVICAAKGGLRKAELLEILADEDFQNALSPLLGLSLDLNVFEFADRAIDLLPRGKALCTVELIACWETDGMTPEHIGNCEPFGDFRPGRYAWELANVKPFAEHFPVIGLQGFFSVEIPGEKRQMALF